LSLFQCGEDRRNSPRSSGRVAATHRPERIKAADELSATRLPTALRLIAHGIVRRL